MYIKELWRYPVKSMAGERIRQIDVGLSGFTNDHTVTVRRHGRLVTSRTDYRLLGLKGTLGDDAMPRISGHPWNSPEALALVQAAAGPDAELIRQPTGRFDVLPLLVATDGAIAHMGFDGRRFRPNIVIGGVEGLEERSWPGRDLRMGDAVIHAAQLRGRCVMTTYDPDTLKQDLNVLRRIAHELDGTMALDCAVVSGGLLQEGMPVTLEPREYARNQRAQSRN
jgi:uncharacterized protein